MKKKIMLTSIIAILIISNIFSGWLVLKDKPATVYKTDILTDELDVKNFTLVYIGDKLYIQDGFIFKLTKEGKVDSINFDVFIDGTKIFDFAGANNFKKSNERIVDAFKIIPNIKISKDSKMVTKVKYTINGEGREFNNTVLLRTIVKYKEK